MRSIALVSLVLMLCMPLQAMAFDSGSTGADGAFNPQSSTEVTLPENGILNYTTVVIPSGVTVTFKKNSANTPVYMLATGDVSIAGIINVSGNNGDGQTIGKGGPGGFDGGMGAAPTMCGGAGLGPGGGIPGVYKYANYGAGGGGGSFASTGNSGAAVSGGYNTAGTAGKVYGNVELIPLVGGSGGSGGCATGSIYSGGGGGGGGVILITSAGMINVTGSIYANGGAGGKVAVGTWASNGGGGGGGSGGAIKLMSPVLAGNGAIEAKAGAGGGSLNYGHYSQTGGSGSEGRLRIEASTMIRTAGTNPSAYSYTNHLGDVFPAETPVLRVVSVGGTVVPSATTGSYFTPDITLPRNINNPVDIVVEASNIPAGTDVVIEARPEIGAVQSSTATLQGTDASSSATGNITLSKEYASVILLTATYTVQTAANESPIFVDGEQVEKIRVASVMGGATTVTYITKSGREVAAAM